MYVVHMVFSKMHRLDSNLDHILHPPKNSRIRLVILIESALQGWSWGRNLRYGTLMCMMWPEGQPGYLSLRSAETNVVTS